MDTTAATMHPAEEYLRNEQNPPVLYVRIYGERRKLFINRGKENVVGIIAKGKRKHGYIFSDWSHIEKIYYPSQEKENEKDMDRKMILKYQKLARLATHTNDWLRKIAAADLEKSLYENRITTGTAIDGKCIRLSTIEKYCGSWNMQRFRQALRIRRNSRRFVSTFAVMTVRFGASRVKTATWLPVSARSTGIAATAITIC